MVGIAPCTKAEGMGPLQRARVGYAWQPNGGNCCYHSSARPSESSLEPASVTQSKHGNPHTVARRLKPTIAFILFSREPGALSRKHYFLRVFSALNQAAGSIHRAIMQVQRSHHEVVPESRRGELASTTENCRLMRHYYFVLWHAWRSPSPASLSL
jgi:hypothetical protein